MKLNQALKLKNRLASDLVRLQEILRRENSRRNDNKSTVDREHVWNSILRKSEELGKIKAQIAKANIGIYDKIERMAELKNRIAYLHSISIRAGEEIVLFGRNQEKMVYEWDAFFKQEDIDRCVSEIQEDINSLQDDIDIYNATTDLS